MRRIQRRQLLAWSGAALAASACQPSVPISRPNFARPRSSRSDRVVVIGAGLAGLAAALELVERGFQVTVLEAQQRPGGRILTLRSPFHDGLYAEAGAMHVVPDPALLRLLDKLGIELSSGKSPGELSDVDYRRGKRRVLGESEEPERALTLSKQELELGARGRWQKYFAAAENQDPTRPGWPPPELARLDRLSAADYLRSLGASAAFVADAAGLCPGGDIETASALALIRDVACIGLERKLSGQGGRIAGGTDRLPYALAQRLGARVQFGARARVVRQQSSGVQVEFVRRGRPERVDADYALIAIPSPLLAKLELQPALSAAKRRAIAELPLAAVTRLFVESDRRVWQEQGLSGRAETDLSVELIRHETALQRGRAGILGAYLTGERALSFGRLGEAERLVAFRRDLEQVFPEIRAHLSAGVSKVWHADPFAQGAYAWYKPGQLTHHARAIGAAEGRLHFAGDHTSYRPGFMHGALASAIRAVGEITKSANRA